MAVNPKKEKYKEKYLCQRTQQTISAYSGKGGTNGYKWVGRGNMKRRSVWVRETFFGDKVEHDGGMWAAPDCAGLISLG